VSGWVSVHETAKIRDREMREEIEVSERERDRQMQIDR
jgi:hypothetical protein